MKSKLSLYIIIGIFLFSLASVSAMQFDNVKQIKEIGKANYPNIEIKNAFGLGQRLARIELDTHQENCGQYCNDLMTITLDEDGVLIDDAFTKVWNEDKQKWEERDIRKLEFYINTEDKFIDVDDYETQCKVTGRSENGTEIKDCQRVKVGSHKEKSPTWTKYNLGEEVKAGVYEIKIVGEKKSSWKVDWIIETQGKFLDEMAVWGVGLPDIHYKFNNNLDNDGSGSVTETEKGTIQYETGVINEAYEPDASNNFKIDDNTYTDFGTGDFTIAYWYQISSDANRKMFYNTGNLEMYYTASADEIRINDGSGVIMQYASTSHYDNNYHHLVWKREGSNNTLWIDGVLRDTATSSQSITTGAIEVGQYGEGLEPIQGMDDLRVYKGSALSDSEISFIYNSGSGTEGDGGILTLNSPADTSISDTNEVTFNATATVTGGANLVNMSLWTNETGDWDLRNLTEFQEKVINEHTSAKLGNDGYTGKCGLKFVMNQDSKNLDALLDLSGAINATKAYLLDNTKAVLATVDIIDATANFTYDVSEGETYYIAIDKEGSGYNSTYFGEPGTVTNVSLNFTGGLLDGADHPRYRDVISITTGGIADYEQTWNRTITDDIIWNVQACDSDGDCGFAPANYSLSIDTIAPTISISAPPTILSYGSDGLNTTLSYQINDSNLESCWYDYNGTNTTAPCTSGEINTTYFDLETGNFNITLYANDSVGNINSTDYSWNYRIFENSQNYSESTIEGSIESFSINITLNEEVEISGAILSYNGTNQTASIDSAGTSRILSVSNFEIPSVDAETNYTFYWHILLDDSSEINSTEYLQTVSTISLDNCSSFTYPLFNISLLDEELLTPLNGTIELYYEVLNVPNYNTIENYSGKFEDISNTLVCSEANLSGQNLVYSTEIRYYSDDYSTEFYNIQKGSLDSSETIVLYDLSLNDSTEFRINYENSNVVKVPDAVVQLQRKYTFENVYRTVEAPLTGEDGTAIVHIDLNTNKYRIIMVKDGEILDIFDNIIFKCENELSGQCEQDLFATINSQNSVSIENLRDFSYALSETNGTVSILFSIPSGEPSNVNIVLQQEDQFGTETLCNRTVYSSSGSIDCTYNTSIGDSYLKLKIYKDGNIQVIKSYIIPEAGAVDFLDNNFFIVFIFLLSIIGMAFTSPEWIIINSVITMLLAGSLWLLNGLNFVMGLGGLMWLLVASGIIIMKISKQEDR